MPSAAASPFASLSRDVRVALGMAVWMLAVALAAWFFTPHELMADTRGQQHLEALLPKTFGDWSVDRSMVAGVVNPQQEELAKRLYSEIVARTYVNSRGDRVMLSVAYGRDQRDTLALHYPEVCYPAQGFQVLSNRPGTLDTPFGSIAVRRLETVQGQNNYFEPVTYWTTLGNGVVQGHMGKKLAEIRYGFKGVVPDGLLFRVSSVDRDSARAFELQQAFTVDLLRQLDSTTRLRLAGLG